jgi:Family of unknown function (DUF5723)
MLAFSLLYFSVVNISLADDRSNARGLGLSNAGMVSSFGIDAYSINPANYDFYRNVDFKKSLKLKKGTEHQQLNPKWEISIMSVGGGYGSDESLDFYNKYLSYLSINRNTFTGLFTDIVSVLQFRDSILPGSKTDANYDFELKWFSVNYSNPKIGGVNFTISDKVGLNTNVLSRDDYLPLNFHVSPNPNGTYNLTNVELHQSEAIAWWIRKYTIGYAKQFDLKGVIKNISAGFSAGLVHGFGNVITLNSSLYVNTYGISSSSPAHVDSIKGKQSFYTQAALTDFFRDYGDGAKSHYTFFPKPAGTGYSFDLGFAMQIGEMFRVAASVTEIGKITWDYNTFINYDTNSFNYKNFNLSSNDPTYNTFVNDLEGLDTRDTLTSYTTDMPTKFRAGIMFQPNDKVMIEFDWVKGNNNLPSNTTEHIFSIGAEYYPVKFLPIRTGFSAGGPEDWNFSLGSGARFKNVIIDLAAYGINNMITDKRLSFAFSAKLIL